MLPQVGSLIIVILVSHASSYDKSFFSASPAVMALFQIAAAHLFLSFFIVVTALHTDKIYETPLVNYWHQCSMFIFIYLFIYFLLLITLIMYEKQHSCKTIGLGRTLRKTCCVAKKKYSFRYSRKRRLISFFLFKKYIN